MNPNDKYLGEELDLFAFTHNWKNYVWQTIRRYIHYPVLEVGAGIGSATEVFNRSTESIWMAIEPDIELYTKLRKKVEGGSFKNIETANCKVGDLPEKSRFKTIVYLDVLEHIKDDAAELSCAQKKLAPDGSIIIVSPAYQWLYSDFDRAIGHFRRYDKAQMIALGEKIGSLKLDFCCYLDSVGSIASLGNRLLLKASQPELAQVLFWDRWLVRCSKLIDPLIQHSFGKSIVAVYKKR